MEKLTLAQSKQRCGRGAGANAGDLQDAAAGRLVETFFI